MNRAILLLSGALFLLLGFAGGPLCWHDEGVLPNLALRTAVWLSASAGVLLLWLGLSSEGGSGRRAPAPRLADGQAQAA